MSSRESLEYPEIIVKTKDVKSTKRAIFKAYFHGSLLRWKWALGVIIVPACLLSLALVFDSEGTCLFVPYSLPFMILSFMALETTFESLKVFNKPMRIELGEDSLLLNYPGEVEGEYLQVPYHLLLQVLVVPGYYLIYLPGGGMILPVVSSVSAFDSVEDHWKFVEHLKERDVTFKYFE